MITTKAFRRYISQSGILREKTVIPAVILDELKDTSRLPTSNKSKQIFLNHNQTADKRFNRIVNDFKLSNKLQSNSLPVNLLSAQEDQVLFINKFKPTETSISQNKYNHLKKDLERSFTKSQLVSYLKKNYQGPVAFSKSKKSKLTKIILDNVWELSISDAISMDDLLITRSVKLSKSDLFLLLSDQGSIIQYLSRVGAKISFDSEKGIQFVGTETQVTTAEILLNNILSSSKRERLDLSTIKKLFLEKYNTFSLADIGRNTEVYFNHLEDDVYELITLNKFQNKRSKRLLVWLLNYNLHTKDTLFLPSSVMNEPLVPFKDDVSLAWNNRQLNLWQIKSTDKQPSKNEFYLNDLERFSDKNLKSTDFQYKHIIEEAKSLPTKPLEDENWKLLEDLGLISKDKEDTTVEINQNDVELAEKDPELVDTKTLTGFSDNEIDSICEKLNDFNYRKELDGDKDYKSINPMMVVTFGNVLLEGETQETSIISKKPEIKPTSKFEFNTNLPLISDKVLSLPLSEFPTLTVKDKNHFMTCDPHNYLVQLKFLPSPYGDENVGNMKYPPVEVWMNLNKHAKPDVETMNIVTVECENNVYVPMPGCKSDIKISCQLTGNVLKNSEESTNELSQNHNDDLSSIEEMLNSTSGRYSKMDSQPGVKEFLKKSTLNFAGGVTSSVEQYMDLNFNGKTVRYHYVSVSFRRQLDFNFGDSLVDLNIVEGGQLGGRRIEVNLVSDMSGDTSKEQLIKLLTDAKKLINEL